MPTPSKSTPRPVCRIRRIVRESHVEPWSAHRVKLRRLLAAATGPSNWWSLLGPPSQVVSERLDSGWQDVGANRPQSGDQAVRPGRPAAADVPTRSVPPATARTASGSATIATASTSPSSSEPTTAAPSDSSTAPARIRVRPFIRSPHFVLRAGVVLTNTRVPRSLERSEPSVPTPLDWRRFSGRTTAGGPPTRSRRPLSRHPSGTSNPASPPSGSATPSRSRPRPSGRTRARRRQ